MACTSASSSISAGVPCLSTRPSCSTVTRSTTRSAMSRSCSIRMKPMCAGSAVRRPTSSRRSAGERPAAGSSNKISRGAPASAMPISSWRCSPWDSDATGVSAMCVRRTRSSKSRVAASDGWPERTRRNPKRPRATPRTARKRLSRTDSSRKSSEDWYVRRSPARMRSWGGIAVTSSPKNRTRPAVAGKSPVITLNNVVLPAPLAPMTARRSPAATDSDTPSTARSAPNVRVTPSSTRASPEAIGAPFLPLPAPFIRAATRASPSWAVRHVARSEPDLVELGLRHAEALIDARSHLDDLVVETAVGALGHLGHEGRPDGLAVLVERDLAGRGLELQVLERLAILRLTAGEIAVHGLEPVEGGLHVDVVHEGEEGWAREAVLEVCLVVGDELLPVRALVGVGDRAGRRRAQQRLAALALEVEHGLVHGDRSADHGLRTARLLVLRQEVDGVRAAEHDQQRVDVLWDLGDHGGVVLRAERHPRLGRHLAARLAVLRHETLHLRVRERVVLGDHHHLLVALVLERVVAEAHHPLGALGVEAEEVRRRVDERRRLRPGRAVDERDVGLRLGVVLDRDALRARERAHHDLNLVLLDQLARGVDGDVGLRVRRGLDDLDLLARHHAVALLHGQLGAPHAVLPARREGALQRREQPDLDRVLRLDAARRDGEGGDGDQPPRQCPSGSFHVVLHWMSE